MVHAVRSLITSNGSPCFLCVKLCQLFVSKLDNPAQKMGNVSHNFSHGGYQETQTTQWFDKKTSMLNSNSGRRAFRICILGRFPWKNGSDNRYDILWYLGYHGYVLFKGVISALLTLGFPYFWITPILGYTNTTIAGGTFKLNMPP